MSDSPVSVNDRIAAIRLDALTAWRTRSRREQIMLAIVGVLACLLVWRYVVWSPLQSWREAAYENLRQIESSRSDLSVLPVGVELGSPRDRPLRQAITASAEAAGLTLTRVEAVASGLEVEIENVEFAQLVGWIDMLYRQDSVLVATADVSRLPSPGFVAARLTFQE